MIMELNRDGIKKILVFRALQLGDLLCSVPAFRALRGAFPQAHIAILGLPWMSMLRDRFPHYIDEFIWFPGYPGLPEQPLHPEATAGCIMDIINRKFDLAIQMQGNGSVVNPLVELFGARHTAGFCTVGHYCPNKEFFLPYPEGIPEVHRHLALMGHLGVDAGDDALEFPVTAADEADLQRASLHLPEGQYVCIHPGSRGAWRQWPAEHFAAMADLCMKHGLQPVLTGTADELPIVYKVKSHMRHEPIVAAGKTNLGAIAALLKHSTGLISNCTGISHIASALRTPSVVISMDGEPERWAPLNKSLHTTIDWTRTQDLTVVQQAVEEQFLKTA